LGYTIAMRAHVHGYNGIVTPKIPDQHVPLKKKHVIFYFSSKMRCKYFATIAIKEVYSSTVQLQEWRVPLGGNTVL